MRATAGHSIIITALTAVCFSTSAIAKDTNDPAPFMPGHVSTAATEVRIAFSPNGRRMLWGTIGWTGGVGGWDIFESVKDKDGWGAPRPVSFNSPQNDFDPVFAPDGKALYFFSNRPGGLGKDDIYVVPFDAAMGTYGTPRNLGPNINSEGNEWAPTLSADGKMLIFSSDGRGGEGGQDLFYASREEEGWAFATPFGPPVNTPNDDFDATFLPGDVGIVMSSGDVESDAGVKLYMSVITGGGFVKPQLIGPEVNCEGGLTLGPTITRQEPNILYFTSNCRKNGIGRMDIFRGSVPEYDWRRERSEH